MSSDFPLKLRFAVNNDGCSLCQNGGPQYETQSQKDRRSAFDLLLLFGLEYCSGKVDCPTCSVVDRGGCSVTCGFGLHGKGSSLAS